MEVSPPDTGKHDREAVTAISSIAYGFMGSQVLFTALDLGLFTTLADGPVEGDELARRVGAHPRRFQALLAACTALRLIAPSQAKRRVAF